LAGNVVSHFGSDIWKGHFGGAHNEKGSSLTSTYA
jgi:hypothetical protein